MSRYLQILQNECHREIQLINDLLDLPRLDEGSVPLDHSNPVAAKAGVILVEMGFYQCQADVWYFSTVARAIRFAEMIPLE
jgi:signal transduction histidine kinase